MNFSEALRVTSNQLFWSPNGKYCAVALTARLEIRDGTTLQLLMSFNCSEYIQSVEWSLDSILLYTANYKRGLVEVWQPEDSAWRCKIDEGAAGLSRLIWCPDSRHILTIAEFHLRVTIWSLVNKTVSYVKLPKDITDSIRFSHDGDYLAVAERTDCKDFISILETKSWTQVKKFEISTRDLAGFAWAPDDSVIAVWDSPVDYKFFIYTISGNCLTSYSAYEWALGIKQVTWSPSAQFIGIGSFDQTIRLMNHITWKIIAEFKHTNVIEQSECIIYKEKEKPLTGYPATLASVQGLPLFLETNYEEEGSRPIHFAKTPSDNKKISCPKTGVSHLLFSADGRFLASRVEDMPTIVWIWSIVKLALEVVLVHCNPVKDMAWSNKQTCLSICTGNNYVYLWTPFGCVTVNVPNSPTMQIISLRWHPSGSKLALVGKECFSICFLDAKKRGNYQENEIPDEPLCDIDS